MTQNQLNLDYLVGLYLLVKFYCLMGEGFILLTRGYGFMGGVPPPFVALRICTFTYDMELTLYR